jgi:CheY-like chemotaxis protein
MPRVLFVEGHSATRQICSRLLRDEGYEVLEARNGRSALDLVKHNELDAVVTDWLLPDMDGFQFLNQLATHRPGPAVIFFSNQPHLCSGAAHTAKVTALIEKTEDVTQLLRALDAVCPPTKADGIEAALDRPHHLSHLQENAPLSLVPGR